MSICGKCNISQKKKLFQNKNFIKEIKIKTDGKSIQIVLRHRQSNDLVAIIEFIFIFIRIEKLYLPVEQGALTFFQLISISHYIPSNIDELRLPFLLMYPKNLNMKYVSL